MMSKKDMDQDQLQWWKDYNEDIAERKRMFRGASSTFRGDTPMNSCGDGVWTTPPAPMEMLDGARMWSRRWRRGATFW